MDTAPLLEIRDLSVHFSGVVAIKNLNLTMQRDQILGLIGPNGSGKTTVFNSISRLVKQKSGDILYNGNSIIHKPAHKIVHLGISRTFQHLSSYRTLTVLENVMTGGHSLCKSGFISNALRLPRARAEEEMLEKKAKGILRDLELYHLHPYPIENLPFTVLKRMELARALMASPKLLLMDEPAGGLNHEEIEKYKDYIHLVREKYNTSILLIEHHMNLLMSVSDHVVAMASGEKIAEGTPKDVQNHSEVIRVYLGEEQ
jgi:branched-chain amino acid transport system ATP-binding protein